jgi:hypothetical protein
MGLPSIVHIPKCLPKRGSVPQGLFHGNGTLVQALRECLTSNAPGLEIGHHLYVCQTFHAEVQNPDSIRD